MKVIGLMAGLLGLGVAGAELSTVTWDARAGVVAGALADAAVDIIAPAPLAAQNGNGSLSGLTCDGCLYEPEEYTCGDLVNQQGVPQEAAMWEWCSELGSQDIVPAHRFSINSFCGGGGDPDFAAVAGGEGPCQACGGTSICHYDYWDAGPCHAQCEGGSLVLARAIQRAVEAEDATRIASMLRTERGLHLDQAGSTLHLPANCEAQGVLSSVTLKVELTARVTALLREAEIQ